MSGRLAQVLVEPLMVRVCAVAKSPLPLMPPSTYIVPSDVVAAPSMKRADVSAFPFAQPSAACALAVHTSIAATSVKAPATRRRGKSLGEHLMYLQSTSEMGDSQREEAATGDGTVEADAQA